MKGTIWDLSNQGIILEKFLVQKECSIAQNKLLRPGETLLQAASGEASRGPKQVL